MNNFWNKLVSSLDVHSKSFSARKLSAFAVMVCVITAHIIWLMHSFKKEDFSLLESVFIIDYGFISVCLGMTTYEAIKNRSNAPVNPTTNEGA
jgi:hypothetical protein